MKFFVGVTDNSWYRHLAKLCPDEVNFWRPSGRSFGAVLSGSPFLFKLHSPENYIAGGGFFLRSEQLPLSLAWDAFGEKNGAPSMGALRQLIMALRRGQHPNPDIGCIILNAPFFLPRAHWIPAPPDWKPSGGPGRTYSTEDVVGLRLWKQVTEAMQFARVAPEIPRETLRIADEERPLGRQYVATARIGQGAFRVQVLDAYQRRCAATGEKALPTLQAAHIRPYADSGPNRTHNGLLLRADLHALFDHGYLTVTPELKIEVSPRIKQDFDNGHDYYPLHGKRLVILPGVIEDHPRREFLQWHNERVYLALPPTELPLCRVDRVDRGCCSRRIATGFRSVTSPPASRSQWIASSSAPAESSVRGWRRTLL